VPQDRFRHGRRQDSGQCRAYDRAYCRWSICGTARPHRQTGPRPSQTAVDCGEGRRIVSQLSLARRAPLRQLAHSNSAMHPWHKNTRRRHVLYRALEDQQSPGRRVVPHACDPHQEQPPSLPSPLHHIAVRKHLLQNLPCFVGGQNSALAGIPNTSVVTQLRHCLALITEKQDNKQNQAEVGRLLGSKPAACLHIPMLRACHCCWMRFGRYISSFSMTISTFSRSRWCSCEASFVFDAVHRVGSKVHQGYRPDYARPRAISRQTFIFEVGFAC
jgi:hypothetical protein